MGCEDMDEELGPQHVIAQWQPVRRQREGKDPANVVEMEARKKEKGRESTGRGCTECGKPG
ncbi:unnamed protein product [Clonostachys rhizophaga]|uniref:Uncharacterized protein n=1 Tax=Clonostachys rhizophaga TaxID=160324 RepID=A0A9N9V4H3_9HYPO|nr:unnamed protein product [Clonostachys rhizophaga]